LCGTAMRHARFYAECVPVRPGSSQWERRGMVPPIMRPGAQRHTPGPNTEMDHVGLRLVVYEPMGVALVGTGGRRGGYSRSVLVVRMIK
jgi:hypothetical protein